MRPILFFFAGCVLALLPVLAVNLVIWLQTQQLAEDQFAGQLQSVRGSINQGLDSVLEDVAQLAAGDALCGSDGEGAIGDVVVQNPMIALAGVMSSEGRMTCTVPPLAEASIDLLQSFESIGRPSFTGAAARLGSDPTAGVLIAMQMDQRRIVAFLPGNALEAQLAALASEHPYTLSFGTTALLASGFVPAEQAQSVQLAADGLLLTTANAASDTFMGYRSLHLWATGVTLSFGALLVLMIGRFVQAAPARDNTIEQAVQRDEFVPYYQPIFDLESGRLSGCEMVVRWQRPDGTIVQPKAFIDEAEQSGLAIPITRSLMRSTVRDLGPSYQARPELKLAINLFNRHFHSMAIVGEVKQIFGGGPIAYEQLVFELTERRPLEDLEQAKRVIEELQALGCRVALDDAGTGHGGLAHLQQLGLDIVKIDKMFIDQLGKNGPGETITHSLTELAVQLGMSIVAEGVETVHQIGHLKRFGIREAQGFLFAPPLPADRFLNLVDALLPTDGRSAQTLVELSRRIEDDHVEADAA